MAQPIGDGPRTSEVLFDAISNCIVLLKRANEHFWCDRLESPLGGRHELSAEDALEILGLFGGMGSFNDLILSTVNGHDVPDDQESKSTANLLA